MRGNSSGGAGPPSSCTGRTIIQNLLYCWMVNVSRKVSPGVVWNGTGSCRPHKSPSFSIDPPGRVWYYYRVSTDTSKRQSQVQSVFAAADAAISSASGIPSPSKNRGFLPECGHDGIGRHARFRFSCFRRWGSSPHARTITLEQGFLLKNLALKLLETKLPL